MIEELGQCPFEHGNVTIPQEGTPEYDSYVARKLTATFTPLIYSLAQNVRQYSENNFQGLELAGGEPALRSYPERVRNFSPNKQNSDLIDLYIWSGQKNSGNALLIYLYSPIGSYGERISSALVNTGRALYSIAMDKMEDDYKKIEHKTHVLLWNETFREKPLTTMLEGIQTLIGATSLLIMNHVDGYNDPLELVNAILTTNLLDQLSLRSPFGLTAPQFMRGYYFRNPVEVEVKNGQKKPKFTKPFQDYLRQELENYHSEPAYPGHRQKGCPVGYRKVEGEDGTVYRTSGLEELTSVIYPLVEHFYTQNTTICNFK